MKIFPTLDKGFPNVITIFYLAQTNEKRNQRNRMPTEGSDVN